MKIEVKDKRAGLTERTSHDMNDMKEKEIIRDKNGVRKEILEVEKDKNE